MRAHYSEIRDIARRSGGEVLEFQLGDEWEALCKFLKVEVPCHPYPRENEGGNWILKMRERASLRAKAAAYKFARFALPVAIVGLGVWIAMSRSQLLMRRSDRDGYLGILSSLVTFKSLSSGHRY